MGYTCISCLGKGCSSCGNSGQTTAEQEAADVKRGGRWL